MTPSCTATGAPIMGEVILPPDGVADVISLASTFVCCRVLMTQLVGPTRCPAGLSSGRSYRSVTERPAGALVSVLVSVAAVRDRPGAFVGSWAIRARTGVGGAGYWGAVLESV